MTKPANSAGRIAKHQSSNGGHDQLAEQTGCSGLHKRLWDNTKVLSEENFAIVGGKTSSWLWSRLNERSDVKASSCLGTWRASLARQRTSRQEEATSFKESCCRARTPVLLACSTRSFSVDCDLPMTTTASTASRVRLGRSCVMKMTVLTQLRVHCSCAFLERTRFFDASLSSYPTQPWPNASMYASTWPLR